MTDFVMPTLGADMESGKLVAWRKKPGDVVRRGEVIAEVETDKGVIDVEVFVSGVLDQVVVSPGQRVPVGAVLATIRSDETPGHSISTTGSPLTATDLVIESIRHTESSSGELTPIKQVSAAPGIRPAISPSARRLARELKVDPISIRGTGRHGAITREDVERAAATLPKSVTLSTNPAPAIATAPASTTDDRAARMRQAISTSMARSKREIPHYYLSTTIDMQPAMDWLGEENARRSVGDRLLFGVLLLKATALALREVPELNALWDGERAIRKDEIHVGVAISLRGGGLIAPAIHHTDRKGLDELMVAFRDLVTRARGSGLRGSELSDPTITVTSLGDQGVESVLGVIYPPQVALVGFGKVVRRPWVVDGGLYVRQVMVATLSADHRVSDGHRGGIFLNTISRLLQEPAKL